MDRFPQIWVPSWENRDLRQLLLKLLDTADIVRDAIFRQLSKGAPVPAYRLRYFSCDAEGNKARVLGWKEQLKKGSG